MRSVSRLNTLQYDSELCTGCEMCVDVCPHAVFALHDGVVEAVRADACIECGACERNCPAGAIRVQSGVGCATAMMLAALRVKKEVSCNSDTPCCSK
jgi:NAD-dependent dihydropyrimidine dehydrogenase PreA subunit